MTGVKKATREIKKKTVTLDSYNPPTLVDIEPSPLKEKTAKNPEGQKSEDPKTSNGKKFKTSVYLTDEAEHQLYKISEMRRRKKSRTDRSSLICEAIKFLYENNTKEETNK